MAFSILKLAFNKCVEGQFILLYMLLLAITVNAQDSLYNAKIDVLYEKGYDNIYINKDSAIYYFNRIWDKANSNNDIETSIDALTGIAQVQEYHHDLDVLEITLAKLDSLFDKNQNFIDNIPEGTIYRVHLAYQKGNYFFVNNDFDKARFFFNEIITTIEKLPKAEIAIKAYLSIAYSFVAKMYSDEGKLNLASEYYERNIRHLKINNPDDKLTLFDNYDLLAEVLKRKKLYNEANSYLLKTLDFRIKHKEKNGLMTVLNIVQNNNSLDQKDSANYYLKIAKGFITDTTPSVSDFHEITAETLAANGDYKNAILEYKIALELTKKKWHNKSHWEIAHVIRKIGKLHAQHKHYGKAIRSFDEAISQLQNSSTAHNNSTLIEIFKNKTAALIQQNTTNSFLATLKMVDLGINKLDILKPTFRNQNDKLFLIENVFPLFESGLEAGYNLYSDSKDENFIDQAFIYAEESKSVLLLEALLSAQATQFANISKDILERENLLKAEITQIEKKLVSSDNSDIILENNLFDLRQEHRNLIITIETNHPDYFNLKYNSKVLSLPEVQEKLTDNEMLISFFYGNTSIYMTSTTHNEKYFEKIAITPNLENDIKKLHAMLSNPKSSKELLSRLSYSLFQKLIAPTLNLYPQEKIIIAPDGLLNYIPFGSLVTNLDSNRFLIEDRAISYVNSASLWSQLSTKKQTNNSLLAFAPSFDTNTQSDDARSNVLGNLPHNRKEVEQIATSFKGQSFLDDSATLQNFTTNVSEYSILHLATHAVFDDKNPEYSYLAFTPNEESEDILLVKDLYNLSLNASLVTLSACESAIGELKRGEGFLSLARGFFYSGASSISSTLWKINDNSSSALMGSFYKNLADGKSKDKSLQEAKLSFLEKNRENGLSHPYYWSGYIIQGNTEPLTSNTSWRWYLLGGSILILIFLGRKRLLQSFK